MQCIAAQIECGHSDGCDVMMRFIYVSGRRIDVLLGTAVPVDAMCDQGVGCPTLTLDDVGEVVSCCHLQQQSLSTKSSALQLVKITRACYCGSCLACTRVQLQRVRICICCCFVHTGCAVYT